jgi:S-adenosylmethionine:tRNA ribosyltransferase-isomerase
LALTAADFDYELPPNQIAQEPLEDRAGARMLVLDRRAGSWSDATFRDLPGYLKQGDCLVLNDSRVLPARLYGEIEGSGTAAELLLIAAQADSDEWLVLAKPGKRLREGARIRLSADLEAEVLALGERGERVVRFHCRGPLMAEIDRIGHMPLPPYIKRADTSYDRERYQTVFAREPGSAAAPTAGLHFTPDILEACRAAGADIARVTLHVGLGTFQPLNSSRLDEIRLHEEVYSIAPDQAAAFERASRRIAVGTTAVRTLETYAATGHFQGRTSLFLSPGSEFRLTGGLLTNFHLPQSSLIMLVAAFAGREFVLDAYRHAVREGYRFFSYGDCMLIL